MNVHSYFAYLWVRNMKRAPPIFLIFLARLSVYLGLQIKSEYAKSYLSQRNCKYNRKCPPIFDNVFLKANNYKDLEIPQARF